MSQPSPFGGSLFLNSYIRTVRGAEVLGDLLPGKKL